MRIGFVGVGGIAQDYLESLKRLGETVVAVCDVDQQRAATTAQHWNANAYSEHHEMMHRESLDALFVCVPPYAHSDQELIAAEQGLALFVAKPVALSLDKAKEVCRAINASGIINQVGYMWRYSDIVDQAREILSGRKIGLVLGFALTNLPRTPWWRIREKSGTQIIEQSTHIFDLARLFAGNVREVQALGRRALMTDIDGLDFEDVSSVNLAFENNAIGNIASTFAIRGGRYALELIARDCHLNINFSTNMLSGTVDGSKIDVQGQNNPYFEQISTFLQAIRDNDQSLVRSNYADASRTLAVTVAAQSSIDSGQSEPVASI